MTAPPSLPRVTLILGGARSGKSTYAESLVRHLSPPPIVIVTAEALDMEMADRITHHRQARPASWTTVEAHRDLATAIAEQSRVKRPILVDCLTLWLTNELLNGTDSERATADLLQSIADAAGPIILVSNEVGLGIVPDNALARRFRDLQGRLNQQVASHADRVVLMAAGLPLTLKG